MGITIMSEVSINYLQLFNYYSQVKMKNTF